jgi:hypothetical protein
MVWGKSVKRNCLFNRMKVLSLQASAFPGACCGISSQHQKMIKFLSGEDSPLLASESFKPVLFFSADLRVVA